MSEIQLSPTDKQMDRQKGIETWFDKTYKNRGFQYLRPVVAYEIYLSFLEVQPQKAFLDIACGIGQMLKVAEKDKLQLSGIDISAVAVQKAKNRLPSADIRKGNAEELPFESESFNYITCLGSLERMINKDKALLDMHRVLKADGRACIMVRNSNRRSWKIFKEKLGIINEEGHQGAMTLSEWSSIFQANNFEVEKVFHDHWPRNRWYWWLSLSGKLFSYDFKKLRSFSTPVESAYELIYILKKK